MARRNQRREKKSGKLAPGFCRICGRIIGGLSGLTVWWCPRCCKLLCKDCCPVGSATKKSVCPECGTEVQPKGGKNLPNTPFLFQNSNSLKKR